MLIELVYKYAKYDGLVNGVDGICKTSITYNDRTIIWIMFQSFKIGTLIGENFNHYYNNSIESKWTSTKPIINNIRVDKSPSFLIPKIQFAMA
jgi:hypothetical protein